MQLTRDEKYECLDAIVEYITKCNVMRVPVIFCGEGNRFPTVPGSIHNISTMYGSHCQYGGVLRDSEFKIGPVGIGILVSNQYSDENILSIIFALIHEYVHATNVDNVPLAENGWLDACEDETMNIEIMIPLMEKRFSACLFKKILINYKTTIIDNNMLAGHYAYLKSTEIILEKLKSIT